MRLLILALPITLGLYRFRIAQACQRHESQANLVNKLKKKINLAVQNLAVQNLTIQMVFLVDSPVKTVNLVLLNW